jgi:hypothetical protein
MLAVGQILDERLMERSGAGGCKAHLTDGTAIDRERVFVACAIAVAIIAFLALAIVTPQERIDADLTRPARKELGRIAFAVGARLAPVQPIVARLAGQRDGLRLRDNVLAERHGMRTHVARSGAGDVPGKLHRLIIDRRREKDRCGIGGLPVDQNADRAAASQRAAQQVDAVASEADLDALALRRCLCYAIRHLPTGRQFHRFRLRSRRRSDRKAAFAGLRRVTEFHRLGDVAHDVVPRPHQAVFSDSSGEPRPPAARWASCRSS